MLKLESTHVPTVMAGRGRQHSIPDHIERHTPNNMDHLAFKYMDMCKVESSTDTDSEISPRWSDTSTMGCGSSAPESGALHRTLKTLKPATRHCCTSMFLDPYDGSSEDSDESRLDVSVSRRTRQQGPGVGGRRFVGRGRRLVLHQPASLREVMKNGLRDPVMEEQQQQQHVIDVQMKCVSESELWVCELDTLPSHCGRDVDRRDLTARTNPKTHIQSMDMELQQQLQDSGLLASRSPTPHTPGPLTLVGGVSPWMVDSSSERSPSPCDLGCLFKRKLGDTAGEVEEMGQRKRQCVVNMEQQGAVDSASEPC